VTSRIIRRHRSSKAKNLEDDDSDADYLSEEDLDYRVASKRRLRRSAQRSMPLITFAELYDHAMMLD